MNRRLTGALRALGVPAALITIAGVAFLAAPPAAAKSKPKPPLVTHEFSLDSCSALATSTGEGARNRFFPLQVGRVWELSNEHCVQAGRCDELEEVRITVLDETQTIDGVPTRVVEEREWVDGELDEVSRNFYAECVGTEDVYYFGEEVVDGDGNPLPDGWRAGVDGARPGIIFPGGAFLLGARYFQELAPGKALDWALNVAMGLQRTVPAGTFDDCVLVFDFNRLSDPKGKHPDSKIYCPGTGIIVDETLRLTSMTVP